MVDFWHRDHCSPSDLQCYPGQGLKARGVGLFRGFGLLAIVLFRAGSTDQTNLIV